MSSSSLSSSSHYQVWQARSTSPFNADPIHSCSSSHHPSRQQRQPKSSIATMLNGVAQNFLVSLKTQQNQYNQFRAGGGSLLNLGNTLCSDDFRTTRSTISSGGTTTTSSNDDTLQMEEEEGGFEVDETHSLRTAYELYRV